MSGRKKKKEAPVRSGLQVDSLSLWLVFSGLFLVALVAYSPVWHGEFLWDDEGHITRPGLRSLFGLKQIWFQIGATQQYYPLVHSVFWAEYKLWGLNTLGYHLVSIALHAFAGFLVVVILRRLKVPGALLGGAI